MKYNEEDFLQLSGIQHFSFCRRQWALIHIEQLWKENFLTAEGMINHQRVHDTNNFDMRNGVLTIRGLEIKSYELGVSGRCDAVEFSPAKEGIQLFGYEGKWSVKPVEYKHGKIKVNDCDRLQTTAQAICLEEMFCCTINNASIFYFDTRRRENFEITSELRKKVYTIFQEMHDYYNKGYTPKVKATNSCKQCSLVDFCLPKINECLSVKKYIHTHMEEEL